MPAATNFKLRSSHGQNLGFDPLENLMEVPIEDLKELSDINVFLFGLKNKSNMSAISNYGAELTGAPSNPSLKGERKRNKASH